MKWTVGAKVGAGFGLTSVILLLVGAVSYHSAGKLSETGDWVAHTQIVLEDVEVLLATLTHAATGPHGSTVPSDSSAEAFLTRTALVDQKVKALRYLTRDNVHQLQRLDALEPLLQKRLSLMKDGIDARGDGLDAAGSVGADKAKQVMEDIRTLLAQMRDEENALLKVRTDEAQTNASSTKWTISIGTFAAFVISSLAGVFITRNIARPLRDITTAARQIAGGDLDASVSMDHRQDEVGVLAQTFTQMTQSLRAMAEVAGKIAGGDLRVKVKPQSDKDLLGNAFASMVENLQRLTGQIAQGVSVLSASASQISTSTTQLASSAAETAAAIAQTTTTVEEVRQTAQVASQKSKTVSESAQKVAQTAYAGRKSTEATIEGMGRIRQHMESIAQSMVRLSDQAQAVGQILATVDDLAAQSNLLAVNASIEAAKAGEQGKGFAVVAQEVRGLAEQSKQATNQVRTILIDIQKATNAAVLATEQGSKAVEAGVKQSGESDKSIQSLSNSVVEAAQTATQIAASSQQQLVGVDQVALAMENIKQASTQSVASAKQLEASSIGLKDLGDQLRRLVEHYKM